MTDTITQLRQRGGDLDLLAADELVRYRNEVASIVRVMDGERERGVYWLFFTVRDRLRRLIQKTEGADA